MLKFVQSLIGLQRIGEQSRSGQHVLADLGLQGLLFGVVHNASADLAPSCLAAALQDAHNRSLVFAACSGDLRGPLAGVHVASLPADESLIRFDLAGQLVAGSHPEGEPNPMVHEPSRLLSDPDGPVNLVGTDAVLGVHNLPHRHEPLVQVDRGVFHNGPRLGGELAAVMAGAALPAVVLRLEGYAAASTARAGNAIRPAPRYQVLAAVVGIGEVYNRFLKGRWVGWPSITIFGNRSIVSAFI